MDLEDVALSWEGHHETLLGVFEKLLLCSNFVDCTIIAGGQRLKAHKEVLSAFSPFFELLFKEDYENPTIILDGFTYEELRSIIEFMYLGRATIPSDKVESLIHVAQSLDIKGLGIDPKDSSESKKKSSFPQKHQHCSDKNLTTKTVPSSCATAGSNEKTNIEKLAVFSTEKAKARGEAENCNSRKSHQHRSSLEGIGGQETTASCEIVNRRVSTMLRDPGNIDLALQVSDFATSSIESGNVSNSESVFKTGDLGNDESLIAMFDVRKEDETQVIPCKRSRTCENEDAGVYADVRTSSDRDSYKHLPVEPSSAFVSNLPSTASLSSVRSVLPLASTSRNELNSTSEDLEDLSPHSELIVKTEPVFEEEYYGGERSQDVAEDTVVFAEPLEMRESASSVPQERRVYTDFQMKRQNIQQEVTEGTLDASNERMAKLIPRKSKGKYVREYELFCEWKNQNSIKTVNEDILLAYMLYLSKKMNPSSLWVKYSMIKSMLLVSESIDISNFYKLREFLKKQSAGYQPTQSKTLTKDEIYRFLTEASDEEYLLTKVLTVIAVTGGCRLDELYAMSIDDVEDTGTQLIITVPHTRNNHRRIFNIVNERNGVNSLELYRKYITLRPPKTSHNVLFVGYSKGKCTTQRLGINSIGGMPKRIAQYLGLANPDMYTGTCFRRTSTLILKSSKKMCGSDS